MIKLSRQIRRADRREDGLSLVELAVTMMIMGVVFAATATLVIGAQRTNHETINRLDQIESARTGVERMSRTLRASVMPSQLLSTCAGCTEDAFIRGESYEVQFYSNIDNPGNSIGPSRVTYTIEETAAGVGKLIQTIQTPNSPIPTASGYQYCDAVADQSPACQSHVKELVAARDVRTDTGSAIFTYYDPAGLELVPSAGALTAEQLASVLSIELRLTVQMQRASEAQPTTYIQRIMLPNAQAVIRQGEEETP